MEHLGSARVWPGKRIVRAKSMFSIVGWSFLCMVTGGFIGVEWPTASSVSFAVATFAATIFFSAIDAWDAESDKGRLPAAGSLADSAEVL